MYWEVRSVSLFGCVLKLRLALIPPTFSVFWAAPQRAALRNLALHTKNLCVQGARLRRRSRKATEDKNNTKTAYNKKQRTS